jgi:hypothetical protein
MDERDRHMYDNKMINDMIRKGRLSLIFGGVLILMIGIASGAGIMLLIK